MDGGDCYAGRGFVKSIAEEVLDRGNRSSPGVTKRFYNALARVAIRAGKATVGSPFDLEGSWHGNDTIWRTVLDLQRILHYGRSDGTLATSPQRTVIHLTDAIVGGQGEGPLAPIPASLRFLTLGMSAPATEWVNAILMGLDPSRIPLTSAAFSNAEPVLANFQPDQIVVRLESSDLSLEEAAERAASRVIPPTGWAGQCESQLRQGSAL